MSDDETQIRRLIETWARAAQDGDRATVLAAHADDVVMFDVTAGHDVAFGWALLRCGTAEEFAQEPDRRLRLTIGLRKDAHRGIVTREHHSFALARDRGDRHG